MSEYDNRNTISLFKNESDNPKAPFMTGTFELGSDVLKDLVAKAKANEPVKARVALWKRDRGAPLSGAVQVYTPKQREAPADDFGLDDDLPF